MPGTDERLLQFRGVQLAAASRCTARLSPFLYGKRGHGTGTIPSLPKLHVTRWRKQRHFVPRRKVQRYLRF